MAKARPVEVPTRRLASRCAGGVDQPSRDASPHACTRASAPATLPRCSALFLVVLLLAGPARAEPLAWDGTLSLDFFTQDPLLAHWELTGTQQLVSEAAPPALQALHIAGGINAAVTALVTDPDALTGGLAAIQVTAALGVGTLSPFPPLPFGPLLTSRVLPVFGVVRLCLLTPSCSTNLPVVSFFQGPATALGVGGTLAGSLPGGTRISIQAAPWTLGTATVPVETTGGGSATAFGFGFVHGPGSLSGTTGATSGEIQLVTPMVAASTGALSGLGRLRMHFVPEPGQLILLASGCLALFVLARRRTRP